MRSITANRTMQSGNAKIRRVLEIYKQVKALNSLPEARMLGGTLSDKHQERRLMAEAAELNRKRIEMLRAKAEQIRCNLPTDDYAQLSKNEESARFAEKKRRYSKREDSDEEDDSDDTDEDKFVRHLPMQRAKSLEITHSEVKKPRGRPRKLTDLQRAIKASLEATPKPATKVTESPPQRSSIASTVSQTRSSLQTQTQSKKRKLVEIEHNSPSGSKKLRGNAAFVHNHIFDLSVIDRLSRDFSLDFTMVHSSHRPELALLEAKLRINYEKDAANKPPQIPKGMHIVVVNEPSRDLLPPYYRVLQAYASRWPIITYQWVTDTLAAPNDEVSDITTYLISDPCMRVN